MSMASRAVLDYDHLPDDPDNPLMESTLHLQWVQSLVGAVGHVLAESAALVTGNVRLDSPDDGLRIAPDLMVVPGPAGRQFTVYRPGVDGPPPSACAEVRSKSSTDADIERRCRRMIELGVDEVYVVDPEAHTADRAELDGDRLTYRDARGTASAALGVTFARSGGHLTLCCRAGLVVRPGDDPYRWIIDERQRADRAATEAADARAQAADARAEAERLRQQLRTAGIEPEAT